MTWLQWTPAMHHCTASRTECSMCIIPHDCLPAKVCLYCPTAAWLALSSQLQHMAAKSTASRLCSGLSTPSRLSLSTVLEMSCRTSRCSQPRCMPPQTLSSLPMNAHATCTTLCRFRELFGSSWKLLKATWQLLKALGSHNHQPASLPQGGPLWLETSISQDGMDTGLPSGPQPVEPQPEQNRGPGRKWYVV